MKLVLVLLLLFAKSTQAQCRGDLNGDGSVTVADVIATVQLALGVDPHCSFSDPYPGALRFELTGTLDGAAAYGSLYVWPRDGIRGHNDPQWEIGQNDVQWSIVGFTFGGLRQTGPGWMNYDSNGTRTTMIDVAEVELTGVQSHEDVELDVTHLVLEGGGRRVVLYGRAERR